MVEVKILDLIKEKDISLNAVATGSGVTYSTLHKLASNRTTSISYNTIDQLCKFFECNIEDIIEYVDIDID